MCKYSVYKETNNMVPAYKFCLTVGYTDKVKKLHRYEFRSMWKEEV